MTTNATGLAQSTWRLGQSAGAQTATATVGTVPAAQFTASVQAGPAAALQPVSASTTSGTVGQPLAAPLVVRVMDAFTNPVPGVQVTFAAASGSGSLQPPLATSDAQGLAQTVWTLGTVPGQHSATATADGVPGAPVAFTATAAAGTAATIVLAPQAPNLNAIGQTVQLAATAAATRPIPTSITRTKAVAWGWTAGTCGRTSSGC